MLKKIFFLSNLISLLILFIEMFEFIKDGTSLIIVELGLPMTLFLLRGLPIINLLFSIIFLSFHLYKKDYKSLKKNLFIVITPWTYILAIVIILFTSYK